jgi:MFS family permease
MSPSYSIRFLLKNRALRYGLFRKYLTVRFFLIMALNMQTTILVYWVYHLTNDVASVGLMGLFEAVPAIGFSFISGHIVDRREKRNLILICTLAYFALSAAYVSLALQSHGHLELWPTSRIVHLVYCGIFFGGMLRAFISPATFALMGMMVPRKLYPNAGTWSSSSWQLGAILGPLLGGLLIAAMDIPLSLCGAALLLTVALAGIFSIPKQAILNKQKEPVLQSLREGFRFVFSTQVILAVLLLDMFAVLFGGATALLPHFAEKILKVDAQGFGWLRAAQGIGAIAMYFILANKPLKTAPGIKLLLCILGFGACLIVFGVSTNFWLSMAVLIASGAFDAVSVVIRGTILQLYTPDEMRGRVAALNTMFISSSNELGEVESGFTAKWMGAVPAVVFGGCMTLVVTAVTFFAAPKLKTLKLEAPEPEGS